MISNEDRELIRKFDSIRQKGYYCNSKQLQSVYNRVFNVSMSPTSCSSCMRQRIQKLVNALNKEEEEEKKAQEALKQEEPGNASSLHSNPLEMSTPIKEEAKEEPTEPKKRGRKPKKEKEE